MNINRNNYEEYFLLYADKELSADEKNMVEMFLKQNPDLEEEFIMLQQSVLKPDNTIELKDKSSLFREEQFINGNNYEEKFLLYADNELTLSEIEETERFALSNPVLQNEFTLLQQVKYEADTSIVFPDKRSLYKKEDDTKVIPFRWKALAAAILLGAGLWTGISYLQKSKSVEVVTNDNTVKPKKHLITNPVTTQKENAENLSVNINKKDENASTKKQNTSPDIVEKKQPGIQKELTIKNIVEKKNPTNTDKILVQKNEDVVINNNLPTKVESIANTNNAEKPVTTTSNQADINLTSSLQNNNAQNASYINDANAKSENYVFYNITTEQFNKSKVGTFFKKVKRFVERKNPLKGISLKPGTAEIKTTD